VSDSIYQAFVEVVPEARNLKGALSKQFAAAGPEAGRAAGKGINSGVLGSVGKLAGPLTAAFAGIGIGRIIGDSISSAADLEQSVGAIDAVFKGSADQMHKWSESAATSVGLTKNEYNQLGTLIGAQLKNGGTSIDQLGKKTNDLIGVGADLSSMFGGTTADAVDALSSALKGERDPIEKYGVSLTQAKIDAEAAALGFQKVGGSLSTEATQAATLSLIMKQTADAHGNFASEADTLSHKQQVLNAIWSDGKAAIGTALLPAVSGLVGMLTGALAPAMKGAEKGITAITTGAAGLWDILGKGDFPGAKNFFGLTEDSGVVDFLFNIRDAFTGMGDAFAPLLPQLVELWQAFSPLSLIFAAIGPQLPVLVSAFADLAASLAGALSGALSDMLPALTTLSGTLVDLIGGLLTSVLPILTGFTSWLSDNTGLVLGFAVAIGAAVLAFQLYTATMAIVRTATTLWAGAQAILNGVMALNPIGIIVLAIIALIAAIIWVATQTTIFQDAWAVMVDIFTNSIGMFKDFFTNTVGMFADFFTNTVGMFVDFGAKVVSFISGFWAGLKARFAAAIQALVDAFLRFTPLGILISHFGEITSFIGTAMGRIGSAISGGITNAVNFFRDLPGKAVDALGNLGSLLVGSGASLIQGFIDGITGMIGNVGDAIGGVMDFVGGFFPHSPAKRGPFSGSGWTAIKSAGLAIGDQFGSGLDAASPTLNAKLGSLVSVPSVTGFDVADYGQAGSAAAPAIYVQNPFTGEYLLAQVDGRTQAAFKQQSRVHSAGDRGMV